MKNQAGRTSFSKAVFLRPILMQGAVALQFEPAVRLVKNLWL